MFDSIVNDDVRYPACLPADAVCIIQKVTSVLITVMKVLKDRTSSSCCSDTTTGFVIPTSRWCFSMS